MANGTRPSLQGLPLLQRSIRYHRPRAPFCGIGYCTNCLVRVGDRTNVRACREGFGAIGQRPASNAWPSPRLDLLAALDVVLPHGIDTLRGFRRPAFLVPLYQRVVRRLSGYDPPPRTGPAPRAALRAEGRVAIVGAGPSGRALARALLERGAGPVVLLDRDLPSSPVEGVEFLGRTSAVFLPPPGGEPSPRFSLVAWKEPSTGVEIRADRVVVATGGYDASLFFAGNDRPGVVTADGALALAGALGRTFERAVVVGGGARAAEVLDRFPRSIGAVVAPLEIGPEVAQRASALGIPLHPRTLVLAARGRRRVRALEVRARSRGETSTIPCDAVVLAHRRIPHPQLFFQAGARMRWSPRPGAYVPRTDPLGRTSVPGLYALGAALGPAPARSIEEVAEALAAPADRPDAADLPLAGAELPGELEGYYRELFSERRAGGKWIACPCEDVLWEEVEAAERLGYRGIEVIKRYTGLGTGLCQGRYCLPDALLALAVLERRSPAEVGFITQRPPVVPTPLAALAGVAEGP